MHCNNFPHRHSEQAAYSDEQESYYSKLSQLFASRDNTKKEARSGTGWYVGLQAGRNNLYKIVFSINGRGAGLDASSEFVEMSPDNWGIALEQRVGILGILVFNKHESTKEES